jgi:ankyrin repeat protein
LASLRTDSLRYGLLSAGPSALRRAWMKQKHSLHVAAMHGDLEQVRTSIRRGEQLSRFDEIGKTPLHYAVEGGHLEVAKELLEAGANVDAQDERITGDTPLATVAGNCSVEMVELLLGAGADPARQGWMQLCALDHAKGHKRGDGPAAYELLRKATKHLPARHRADAKP